MAWIEWILIGAVGVLDPSDGGGGDGAGSRHGRPLAAMLSPTVSCIIVHY